MLPSVSLGDWWKGLVRYALRRRFAPLRLQVLDRLDEQGRLDWDRASVDTMSVRAMRGGPCGRKSRRSWQALSKLHLVCDGGGLPLAAAVTAANVNDTTMFQAVVADIPPIARREVESSTRLGRHRWKVERALSWLSCYRRLHVRWDRDAGQWFAFVLVACAVVCFNRL